MSKYRSYEECARQIPGYTLEQYVRAVQFLEDAEKSRAEWQEKERIAALTCTHEPKHLEFIDHRSPEEVGAANATFRCRNCGTRVLGAQAPAAFACRHVWTGGGWTSEGTNLCCEHCGLHWTDETTGAF